MSSVTHFDCFRHTLCDSRCGDASPSGQLSLLLPEMVCFLFYLNLSKKYLEPDPRSYDSSIIFWIKAEENMLSFFGDNFLRWHFHQRQNYMNNMETKFKLFLFVLCLLRLLYHIIDSYLSFCSRNVKFYLNQ